jgi:hypothetical protein
MASIFNRATAAINVAQYGAPAVEMWHEDLLLLHFHTYRGGLTVWVL